MADAVKLRARDAEDLAVISAMLQDGLAPIGDIGYLSDERSFVMAVNRYRWERETRERIHAGLRFDAVREVSYRGIDRKDRSRFLSFLAITYEGGESEGVVVLQFAGGGAIRLDVGGLNCIMADFDESWPTLWTPKHHLE